MPSAASYNTPKTTRKAKRPGVAGRPKGRKNFVKRGYRRARDASDDEGDDNVGECRREGWGRRVRQRTAPQPKAMIALFQVRDTKGALVAFPSHMRWFDRNDTKSYRELADWKSRTEEYIQRNIHTYPQHEYIEVDVQTSLGAPTVVGGETYRYTREKKD